MAKEEISFKSTFKRFIAPMKKPWFWAIVIPFGAAGAYFDINFDKEAKEIHRIYGNMRGLETVEYDRYKTDDKEIFQELGYLDERGVVVDSGAVRLFRGLENFLYKTDPLRVIGLKK